MQITVAPVPQGPRAYRNQLRRIGPLAALLPAGVLGLLSWLLLHGSTSAARGMPGFALAVLAAPLLLVAGVPLSGNGGTYLLAGLASAVLWMVLGVVASRRATRSPVATWRDFWRDFSWLAGGIWLGVLGAVVAANLVLGRPFV